MDSNKNSKMKMVFDFLIKVLKVAGKAFRGIKCDTACCNSECMNKKECNLITLQDQKEEELK